MYFSLSAKVCPFLAGFEHIESGSLKEKTRCAAMKYIQKKSLPVSILLYVALSCQSCSRIYQARAERRLHFLHTHYQKYICRPILPDTATVAVGNLAILTEAINRYRLAKGEQELFDSTYAFERMCGSKKLDLLFAYSEVDHPALFLLALNVQDKAVHIFEFDEQEKVYLQYVRQRDRRILHRARSALKCYDKWYSISGQKYRNF